MSQPAEQAPGLLHNSGCAPRASILWRGIGRGPLADDAERIEVARRRGTWLHLTLSIGQANERYHRDWNTAGALLRLLCLLYTSPSPRDRTRSRMPSSA